MKRVSPLPPPDHAGGQRNPRFARKLTLALAAFAVATVGVGWVGLALTEGTALAHADRDYYAFLSRSGNVRCVLSADDGPAPTAQCQIAHYTDVPPPAGPCADGGATPGWEFRLDQGKYPYLPCEYSAGARLWPDPITRLHHL
jgi:hypothetical protein